MRIRKLAIAALIAAAATATAFAQSALDQSVPRVSPTTAPRVSPTPTDHQWNSGDTTRTRNCDRSRWDTRTGTCGRSPRHEVRCRQRPKNNSRRYAGNRCTAVHTVRAQRNHRCE